MKKIFLTSFLFIVCLTLLSQPAGKWSTGGNAIQAGDFIGTTNNLSFDFRVNNVQQMSLGINGIMTLNSLIGIGNRILLTDANGNIIALPQGAPDQFLLSNGTWGNLPLSATVWKSIGNDLVFMGGNLGIGIASPAYKLDVLGDAHISNNLYVGGGIVVTDKLDANIEVKAGDVIVNNDLSVTGSSRLSGVLTASQGIMFDATNGFKMYAGNSIIPDIFAFGRIGPTGPPTNLLPCLNITTLPVNSFAGRMQVYDATNNIALTMGSDGVQSTIEHSGNNGLLINYYCGKDIFLGTGTGTGAPNDIGGMAGASVFTGDKFYARKNVQIGNPGIALDNNVALNLFLNGTTSGLKLWSGANPNVKLIHDNYDQFTFWGNGSTHFGNVIQIGFTSPAIARADILMNINAINKMGISSLTNHNGDGGYNTLITVNRNLTKALAVVGPGLGPTNSGENFLVNGDGKTEINTLSSEALIIKNALNNEVNFKVKNNGFVYAREINVMATAFPDYVFEKSYKLLSISELDNYIATNKHLPGFKKAEEYIKEGINVKEVLIKQQEKLEELTLYIIELKKEVENLKK